MTRRERIRISGQVQGVGFRPAVYRLARRLGLTGSVYNDTQGVMLELQGDEQTIDKLLEMLKLQPDKPPLAEIRSYERTPIDVVGGEQEFVIARSNAAGTALSQVTADIATCPDCLAELAERGDFRYRYPFINCTNCGPRYSIVRTIPYDRPNTTMAIFPMCGRCVLPTGRGQWARPMIRIGKRKRNQGINQCIMENTMSRLQQKARPTLWATVMRFLCLP